MKVKTAFMSFAFALLLFGSIVNETHSGPYASCSAGTDWVSASAQVLPKVSNLAGTPTGMYTGYGNAYVIVGGKYRGSSGNIWVNVYLDSNGEKDYDSQGHFVHLSGWPWQSKTASASGYF